MNAYNENNFNKLLEEYTAISQERDALKYVIHKLATHMLEELGYDNEKIAKITAQGASFSASVEQS
jgi:hypothetical protein